MSVSLVQGAIGARIDRAFERLAEARFAEALWNRDARIWSPDEAVRERIANRLGWLHVLEFVSPELDRLRGFAEWVRTAGITDVVLLGMGGSSLAPEVMRQVLGVSPASPRFQVLDTVNPEAVREAMARAETSLFLFASKSGTTIEPNVMAAEARRRVEDGRRGPWGSSFVAITDENTALHRQATAAGFRDIFVNPSDIGGRYSALSFFGLVPAALMGIDLERLVSSARAMADACQAPDPRANPGLALGAMMAAAAEAGRDKLTLVLPPALAPFGLWVEQLVAESTGKEGKGVVPISGEVLPAAYSDDRAAVAVTFGDQQPDAAAVDRLRASGAPAASIVMPDASALGAEFFRWEIATAAAGWLLGINPFDEPNVQQAKDATRALLETYTAERRLPAPEPHASHEGVRMALSAAAREQLGSLPPDAFLTLLRRRDYFCLLPYASPEAADLAAAFERWRAGVGAHAGVASMLGYGPRYLHSTGQLHKGGPPNGVFVIVTAAPEADLAVPGQPYSFGVLEAAQALGDFASLDKAGRRALLLQMARPDAALFRTVAEHLLAEARRHRGQS